MRSEASDSVDAAPAAQVAADLKTGLQELRAEISRGQADDAERSEGLRAEIARSRAEDAERLEEIATGLGRIGRMQRDGLSRRVARLVRGATVVLRGSMDRRGAQALVGGARVLLDRQARRTWMDLFDADEYLDAYGDVVKANVPASLHYLLFGHQEGREPSSRFSGTAYLSANRDVANVGMNPLIHFAIKGQREGRPAARPARARKLARPSHVNSLWPAAAPLVSVVIPCFNYGRSLPRAVESVLSQTWQDLEVIVIEGGSTDADSVTAVRELEAARPPRTTFYYRDQRHLVGDNRNYGISRAQGRYIVCLDPDDELEPVYLEVALFLAEAFAYDLVYPSAQCFGESDVTWLVSDASFRDMLRANHIPTVALFRRSAWVEAGGFRDWGTGDSHVPEDWAFWTRLVGMGYRSKAIRQPLMRYHVHAGSLSAAASSDLAAYRPAIRDANADLLDGASVLATEPDSGMAQNPYCNLLSRGPSEGVKGSLLIAMPYVTVGGAERLMASLAASLVDDGYRVLVVTSAELPENTPDGASVLRASTGQVYELPGLFTDRAQQDAYLLFLIQRYRVDTLLVVGSRLVYELLPEIRRTVPCIGVVDQLFNAVGHTTIHSEFSSLIDLAVVPSTELKTQLEDEWETSAEVSVIPHAVHIDGIGPQDPRTLGDGGGRPPTIGYFGRWSEEKGPDLFVEICRAVAAESHAAFVMTGDGPMHDRVHALIKRGGLGPRLRTLGFVTDAASIIAEVDIVVVPSRLDGMPLVILEAMALGKPIVASAVGSIPEVIDDGRTGYLCQPGDIAAFATRVVGLAADPAARARLGAAAAEDYAEHYSWERVYHQYHEAFARASQLAAGRTATP